MEVQRFSELTATPGPRPAPPVLMELAAGLGTATQDLLRSASGGRQEAICLWAGRPASNGRALITHLIGPVFESTARFLTVPPSERLIVAEFLREERLLLFADVHTHPEEAFLSSLDRARPFSVRNGFYAGVVPDFGQGDFGAGWGLFEVLDGEWREVDISERVIA